MGRAGFCGVPAFSAEMGNESMFITYPGYFGRVRITHLFVGVFLRGS